MPLWSRADHLFRTTPRDHQGAVKGFLASKDPDRWEGLLDRTKDPAFVQQLMRARADKKLVQYAKSMHGLQAGKMVANVSGDSGKAYSLKRLPDGRLACTCRDWRHRGGVSGRQYNCKHLRRFQLKEKVAVTRFADMTKSFFDEIEKIDMAKRESHEDNKRNTREDPDRPYSSILTQDDEPDGDYCARPVPDIDEPEVVLGGNAA